MLVLLLFGALIVLVGWGLISTVGHPVLDGWYSRCPACATDTLRPLDAGVVPMRKRFSIYRCEQCGKAYRAELGGTLVEMD
jgi:hypothetical protein